MRLITVKEYDVLVPEGSRAAVRLRNRPSTQVISRREFGSLVDVITTQPFGENVVPFSLKGHPDIVQVQHYVGVVMCDSHLQVEILPKTAHEATNADLRRILLEMLFMCQYLPQMGREEVAVKSLSHSLLDVFIHVFLANVKRLLMHGISSDYVSVQQNQRFFRGKLLTVQNLRANMHRADRFFMENDEYLVDHPANRILKSALELVRQISKKNEHVKLASQLLLKFNRVSKSHDFKTDFKAVKDHRNMVAYREPLAWARLILEKENPSTNFGKSTGISIVFPMERLFQDCVAMLLRSELQTGPIQREVSVQETSRYLFDNPKKFKLRPDILVKDFGGIQSVLDTKWKILNPHGQATPQIDISDMYQLFAYSKKFGVTHVWLVAPELPGADVDFSERIRFVSDEPATESRTVVHVKYVDLLNLRDSVAQLAEALILEQQEFQFA